ncbi:reductive dehalogenase [Dehalobacter restrictus]|uniref:Tetrachloroethene dehalogenase n=2 Tax=Bacteria TaxID=2 RepID=A0ABN4BSH8_DEHRP|nr:reductive dehalogenase [Dehalobacter restrictus]AHF10423.1 tetrachloroethene dehalogenase [Dehalobacter restrictus DSM 9455]
MTQENENCEKAQNNEAPEIGSKGVSRRGFLRSMGLGVGVAGAAALLGTEVPGDSGKAYGVTELDDFPVEMNSEYKRYDQRGNVFFRGYGGETDILPILNEYLNKKMGVIPTTGGEGFGQLEFALRGAAWSVEDDINDYHAPGFAGLGMYKWDGPVSPNKYQFSSPDEASKILKKASLFLGADKVGIAPYDERWIYSYSIVTPSDSGSKNHKESAFTNLNYQETKFPFTPTNVLVFALEMDFDAIDAAPGILEHAAVGNEYSEMGNIAHKVASFIRLCGYNAIPCGNDTGLSVPMAIHAGLGELSRIGILVTPEYGPRVRLCKVITDLPMTPDKPITFGVKEFCTSCMKCADHCPKQAISKQKEPSFDKATISTSAGVKRWALDCVKCISNWAELGSDCAICIQVCPFNKQKEWQHDLARLGANTPARSALRYFDDLFGYGKTDTVQKTKEFWNKKS